MPWKRTSTVERLPPDPVGEAVAATVVEILASSSVELVYAPTDGIPPEPDPGAVAVATAEGPTGWSVTLRLHLPERLDDLLRAGACSLTEIVAELPEAALATAAVFRAGAGANGEQPLGPALRRALRDAVAAEVMGRFASTRLRRPLAPGLLAEAVEYLIELSGSRVESHDLTHGVLVTDALTEEPRIRLRYPHDVRPAKRAPLLFDGQRAVLVVDTDGRARTELQAHRVDRLGGSPPEPSSLLDDSAETGALVAEATRHLGGIGLFLRADRSVWAYVDGRPLLVRRGEHWTSFPLELEASIERLIGGGPAAAVVGRTAFMISGQRHGAILAIVDDAGTLDGVVPLKDRYDLRDQIDPTAMRAETRLHHLIDAEHLDEHTLSRLAALDGATVVDRDGSLIAYGAIVASSDSQHEGARTAAARSLSESALVVLKVSADGDITIFRDGRSVTRLLAGAHT